MVDTLTWHEQMLLDAESQRSSIEGAIRAQVEEEIVERFGVCPCCGGLPEYTLTVSFLDERAAREHWPDFPIGKLPIRYEFSLPTSAGERRFENYASVPYTPATSH